jgi:hypothetical protein
VLIETKFSAPYASYSAAPGSYQMAYGICYVLGCNYRNATVTFVTGDRAGKQDFVYSVVFYTMPGSSNLTAFPAALSAALPSTSPTTPGTIAYGMGSTQNGALSTLVGVYPASSYTFSSLPALPPLPQAAPLSPPLPPRPLPSPPPPPPMIYTCTCTNGYSGADCSYALPSD